MVTQPTDGLAVDSVSMTLAAVTGSAPQTAVLRAGQQVEETGGGQPLRQPVGHPPGFVDAVCGGADFGQHGLGGGQQVAGSCHARAVYCGAHTLPPCWGIHPLFRLNCDFSDSWDCHD